MAARQVSVRKNQSTLSADEKQRLVTALLAVKASGKYDEYVRIHLNMGQLHHTGRKRGQRKAPPRGMAGMGPMGHMIHGNPTFLPWHRELLRRMELDLQAIDSNVTIPYWDWTVDAMATSSLWQPDFLGGNGRASDGRVMDGPFAYEAGQWTLKFNEHPEPDLKRAFGVDATALPGPADVMACLAETPLRRRPLGHVEPAELSQPARRLDRRAGRGAGREARPRPHLGL